MSYFFKKAGSPAVTSIQHFSFNLPHLACLCFLLAFFLAKRVEKSRRLGVRLGDPILQPEIIVGAILAAY
jgi:hypothetical protein